MIRPMRGVGSVASTYRLFSPMCLCCGASGARVLGQMAGQAACFSHPELQGFRRWMQAPRDAKTFYARIWLQRLRRLPL